jgi:peroxiredoxin
VAPDFRLVTIGSGVVQLSLLRDRPTVVAFFCRCGLCHAVAKALARSPRIADRARIYAVFGDVAVQEPEVEKAFRDETGFTAPFLIDISHEVALLYDSVHCPRLWVIDRNGTVRYVNPSASTPPDTIVREALRALAGAP